MHIAPIPVVVLGGFLGAGKTTLLNKVLDATPGVRSAVLVNDFGAINVDAGLVAAHDGQTISLRNGCVCCSLSGGMTFALERVLAMQPPVDRIIIEASGVSDPGRLSQVAVADPLLRLDAVLVLADAERIRDQALDPYLKDTVVSQLASADLLVLTHVDDMPQGCRDEVAAWVRERVPGVPVTLAPDDLAATLATGGIDPCGRAVGAPARVVPAGMAAHRAQRFESRSLHFRGVLVADALRACFAAMPRSLVRAKGWIRTDRHAGVLLQFAGRRVQLDRHAAPPTEAAEESFIVFIGLAGQLAVAQIEAALRGAMVQGDASKPIEYGSIEAGPTSPVFTGF